MTPPARTMCAFQRPPKDRSRVALRGRSWSSPGPERQQSLAPRRNPRGLRSWEAMGRSSAQRKFIRGLEQVAAICREVKAFESADAYGVTTKREVRASGQIEYTCFAVERQAPSDQWPLLLGDAIHNLRASPRSRRLGGLQATDSSNRLSDLHGRLRVPSERSSKGPRAPIRSKGTDRGSATIQDGADPSEIRAARLSRRPLERRQAPRTFSSCSHGQRPRLRL